MKAVKKNTNPKSARATKQQIERKFANTAFKLSQERNDFLLPQVVDFVIKKNWINLKPEYQRRLVWDQEKRSLFIESLLLNIPIPQLFLYEHELGRYEVMDGQQRLNAILDFYGNKYSLKGLERWDELNGLTYSKLPALLKRGLDRRRVSATVLLVESASGPGASKDLRKLVFERLNTGGETLNAQELRNCLYDSTFNKLLIELAKDDAFTEAWDIPKNSENVDAKGNTLPRLAEDRLYRRMIDCEIVLRYFAFRQRAKLKGSVRSMLDNCMEANMTLTTVELKELKESFLSRLEVTRRIFGPHAFKYKDEHGRLKFSQPLYDAQIIAVDQLWAMKEKMIASRVLISKAIGKLIENEKAFEVIVGRPNTAKAIGERIDLIARAMKRVSKQ